MAGKIYTSKISTLSYDYMKDGSFNPTSCLRVAQAIAEEWSISSGFYVRDLMKSGRVVMMVDSVCEFGERGLAYEGYVNGEYWPAPPQGRLIVCNYRFTDSKGGLIFSMVNYYMAVDLKERRALYPEDLSTPLTREFSDEPCPVKNPSFEIVHDLKLTEYEKRVVRRNETDVLGHVNNTCYAPFATDTFTGDDFDRGFSRMVIRFLSELRKGEEMSIMKGEDDKRIVVTGIKPSGKTSFETLFERR
ncbi:MAG: hypothetical protein IKD89_05460 [Clostridia bacterium]|nr:hypothetical protein [Clostridia bacterium]